MLFSSLIFLFGFLPILLVVILASPRRCHNALLLLASLVFYAWGGVSYTLVLLLSILVNYLVGRMIDHYQGTAGAKRVLWVGIGVNLLLLIVFKYANFVALNINGLLEMTAIPPVRLPPIALPIGISFYTFQAISYLVDMYRGEAAVQRSLPRLGLYISLFPQLIAGPIVRYHDIEKQLTDRRLSWEKFASGIERFILGLGKKVLLANNFALLADEIFAVAPANLDMATAWVGVLAYTLQIYFDFSGYSDMAIGLGRMLGFQIPENFNFPYIARSIREFWRRWHISLSQWFRDYVYFSLGGNRISEKRTYLNLFIVFLLTGLWHGASWNFVVWGLFHGFFMVLERRGLGNWLSKTWQPISHLYTLLIVTTGWVFFRAENLGYAWKYLEAMFVPRAAGDFRFDPAYYFNYELLLAFGIGMLASTPVFRTLYRRLWEYLPARSRMAYTYDLFSSLFLMAVFVYCTISLVSSAYNPFIYFRF